MSQDPTEKIALSRFRAIAEVVGPGLEAEERHLLLRQLASLTHELPDGSRREYSLPTLERWLRNYQEQGLDGLRPRVRTDSGSVRRNQEMIEQACRLRQELPTRSADQIARILQLRHGIRVPPRSIRRHLLRRGLLRAALTAQPIQVYGRFQADRANELWIGDFLDGPPLPFPPKPGGRGQTHLFLLLDDYSRLIVHARWGAREDARTAQLVFRQAILLRGRPQATSESSSSPSAGAPGWRELPPSPLALRARPSVVWTGHQAIFWGGLVNGHVTATEHTDSIPFNDGAAFDPRQRSWRPMSSAPIAPRFDNVAIWTGREVFIWGGRDANSRAVSDGAAYDPAKNAWRKVAASPISSATGHSAFWTGSEVDVWGSGLGNVPNSNPPFTAGAAYDPTADSWRRLAPPPTVPDHPILVQITGWTGKDLYVWSYWERRAATGPNSFTTTVGTDLSVYNSARDAWRAVPTQPDQPPLLAASVFWTGQEFVEWGGGRGHGPPPGPDNPGYLFNPQTSAWRRMGAGPIDQGSGTAVVWTGTQMIAITGSEIGAPNGQGMSPGDGGIYSAATNSWARIPRAPGGTDYQAASVWAGGEMILWGGDPGARPPNPGFSYTP